MLLVKRATKVHIPIGLQTALKIQQSRQLAMPAPAVIFQMLSEVMQ